MHAYLYEILFLVEINISSVSNWNLMNISRIYL